MPMTRVPTEHRPVNYHGAALAHYSVIFPPDGTTFTVRLPRHPSKEAPRAQTGASRRHGLRPRISA
jgi:hypothetical protein